jgi:hypothetical protein
MVVTLVARLSEAVPQGWPALHLKITGIVGMIGPTVFSTHIQMCSTIDIITRLLRERCKFRSRRTKWYGVFLLSINYINKSYLREGLEGSKKCTAVRPDNASSRCGISLPVYFEDEPEWQCVKEIRRIIAPMGQRVRNSVFIIKHIMGGG